jgi:dual specificity tyrosine-phosphorylation-regulated kinase 2/3/4
VVYHSTTGSGGTITTEHQHQHQQHSSSTGLTPRAAKLSILSVDTPPVHPFNQVQQSPVISYPGGGGEGSGRGGLPSSLTIPVVPPPPPPPRPPPPCTTTRATTGKTALFHSSHLLTSYERQEICEYDEVYFVGRPSTRKILGHSGSAPDLRNHGYDDDRGDYKVVIGDHIAYRYEVKGVLGRGSFGSVLHCIDHENGQHVAVKLIRNRRRFQKQAQIEAQILQILQREDSNDEANIVRAYHTFSFRSHLCITFELLHINLYDYLKEIDFKPQTTAFIRHVAEQVLKALNTLHRLDIIHADLKPENILQQGPHSSYVKVIDFGSSCFTDKRLFTYIQSRFYRSPEVILGKRYETAIDIWSLGCVLAELATGHPIFPGEDEGEQMACIMEVLGCPPSSLLSSAPRASVFFDVDDAYAPLPIKSNSSGGSNSARNSRVQRPGGKTLEQFLKGASTDKQFVDFLKQCLVWNPEHRITASEALQHPFITGCSAGHGTDPSVSPLESGWQSSSSSGSRRFHI